MDGFFWSDLAAHGGRPALIGAADEVVTYAELAARADAWAARLAAAAPAGRAPLILLEAAQAAEPIAAYLGALRAGFPVLLVQPGQGAPDHALVTAWAPALRLLWDGAQLPLAVRPEAPPHPAPHPDLRVLLSTSGSTGEAKLVRLSAKNIAANALSIASYLDLQPDDRAMAALPLFYSYGMSVLHSHLAAGACVILNEAPVSDSAFWPRALALGATGLALVPHQIDLLGADWRDAAPKGALRRVTQAGGRLDPATARAWGAAADGQGWRFFVMYGQTEAAPRMAYVPPESLPAAADTIGRAIPGGRLWLTDANGATITEPGIMGELHYQGANVMMGYARRPADLALPQGPDILPTGDMAEMTEGGLFRIVGRARRFVKVFGLRISLDQVEAHLQAAGIPAAAVARDDRMFVFSTRPEAVAPALRAACDLPPAAYSIRPVAELPRLPSGKTDFVTLTRMAAEAAQTPADPPGEPLRALLSRLTGVSPLPDDASFLQLGGDSLAFLRVKIALQRRLGHVPEGWETLPVATLESLRPGRARAVRVDPDVILRLVAVSMVVVQHATDYPVYGGTWMLVLLMGFSFFRHQFGRMQRGRGWVVARQMLTRVLSVYALILGAYALYRGALPLSFVTLTANYDPGHPYKFLAYLWFISLYAQLVLLTVLVWSLPGVRAALQHRARTTLVVALAAALALHLATGAPGRFAPPDAIGPVLGAFPVPHRVVRGLIECLPLFLLGGLIGLRPLRGARRLLVAGLAAVVIWAFPVPTTSALLGLVAATGILLFAPPVRLPAWLGLALLRAAATTFYVYLLHQGIVHMLRYETGFIDRYGQAPTAALTLVLAFAAARLVDRAALDRALTLPWRLLAGALAGPRRRLRGSGAAAAVPAPGDLPRTGGA